MSRHSKIRVALLSGGISSERDVSLKSGQEVYDALDKNKYDITRYDPKTDIGKLVENAENIDMALIILHGPYGEDGTIQGLLDLLGIPYQGSGVLGSAIAMNKLAAKRMYEQAGIPTAPYASLTQYDAIEGNPALDALTFPVVIKPLKGGSSIGMSLAKTKADLIKSIKNAFEYDDAVLLESYVKGIELTCGVMGNNDSLEPLPIVEIVPGEGYDFFDYEAKYKTGATDEICPARINENIAEQVRENAIKAHKHLFCKGYSRSDFIFDGKCIYILETNTIPGMTPNSLLPLSAKAAGISFSGLLDRLIRLSLENAEKQNKN